MNALAMLPHLAKCASERRTITYGELGELIGVPAFFMTQPLDVLRDQILSIHHLPRLDALVVNKDTGEVGDSFYADGMGNLTLDERRELLSDEREKVFAYDRWNGTVANLRKHYGIGV